MNIFKSLGCAAPDILLPREGIDLKKWAVIACDQYTSEQSYWTDAERAADGSPSSLNLILPEVYLGSVNESARLASIADTAAKYLNDGIFTELPAGFILTDRSTSLHPSRRGLMIAVDLEAYSFEEGNTNICRATEGTVISRIPPRIRIRANSPLELPHIMLLIDDPDDIVIGKAFKMAEEAGLKPVYDTDLMLGSGHITGTFIEDGTAIAESVISGLETIKARSSSGLLFLVGDGNHSLASAKALWEQIREGLSDEEKEDHPARFALAEVVNIHDKGLDFEPIHRVIFGMDQETFLKKAEEFFKDNGFKTDCKDGQTFVVTGEKDVTVSLKNPPHSLAAGSLQLFIDNMMITDQRLSVDYIHGEDSVRSLSTGNATGILLPAISKDTFFDTVDKNGVFPRKTFSMGEAFEKRFYLEARKIRK